MYIGKNNGRCLSLILAIHETICECHRCINDHRKVIYSLNFFSLSYVLRIGDFQCIVVQHSDLLKL